MKAEYANVFITSAVRVFQHELKIHLSRKELKKKESPFPGLPVCIILGITGFLQGQIVYAMDQEFAQNIALAMLPNKLPAEIKKMENSAISEIANIITGQATIALAGETEIIHITPPAVVKASEIIFDFLQVPTIALSMICEIGLLEINIALTEGNGR